jgi:hypothetical protein
MYISQHDVATMRTEDLKRLAMMYAEVAVKAQPPSSTFSRMVSHALVRVIKERRTLELLAEAELMNPDDEGELIPEPETDAPGAARDRGAPD